MTARADGVWLSITALAHREGTVVAVRHAVLACAGALGAGAALSVAVDHRPYEPVFATDARSDELAELQATLGEGPSIEAARGDGPVLGGDLAATDARARWPEFAPLALARGVAAIFAIPVGSGAARVGVLSLYRDQPDALSREHLDAVLRYADAAMTLALDDRGGLAPGAADLIGPSFSARRAEVHQATGMISVQLGISLTDALVTLRARAYAEGRPLSYLAADVVSRRTSFGRDGPGLPGETATGHTGSVGQDPEDNDEEVEGE
ncbi:MAG TPA: GAF and ANTAR domain-containing protein [Streptosporangiaceae bacterium]